MSLGDLDSRTQSLGAAVGEGSLLLGFFGCWFITQTK